ncbi:MAG: hypothetical protein RIR70_945, partial [Pseudomonadota bacterium]
MSALTTLRHFTAQALTGWWCELSGLAASAARLSWRKSVMVRVEDEAWVVQWEGKTSSLRFPREDIAGLAAALRRRRVCLSVPPQLFHRITLPFPPGSRVDDEAVRYALLVHAPIVPDALFIHWSRSGEQGEIEVAFARRESVDALREPLHLAGVELADIGWAPPGARS